MPERAEQVRAILTRPKQSEVVPDELLQASSEVRPEQTKCSWVIPNELLWSSWGNAQRFIKCNDVLFHSINRRIC